MQSYLGKETNMHPAFSVIFFTTASGAGYGLLVLLGLFAVFDWVPMNAPFNLVAVSYTHLRAHET